MEIYEEIKFFVRHYKRSITRKLRRLKNKCKKCLKTTTMKQDNNHYENSTQNSFIPINNVEERKLTHEINTQNLFTPTNNIEERKLTSYEEEELLLQEIRERRVIRQKQHEELTAAMDRMNSARMQSYICSDDEVARTYELLKYAEELEKRYGENSKDNESGYRRR